MCDTGRSPSRYEGGWRKEGKGDAALAEGVWRHAGGSLFFNLLHAAERSYAYPLSHNIPVLAQKHFLSIRTPRIHPFNVNNRFEVPTSPGQ